MRPEQDALAEEATDLSRRWLDLTSPWWVVPAASWWWGAVAVMWAVNTVLTLAATHYTSAVSSATIVWLIASLRWYQR